MMAAPYAQRLVQPPICDIYLLGVSETRGTKVGTENKAQLRLVFDDEYETVVFPGHRVSPFASDRVDAAAHINESCLPIGKFRRTPNLGTRARGRRGGQVRKQPTHGVQTLMGIDRPDSVGDR